MKKIIFISVVIVLFQESVSFAQKSSLLHYQSDASEAVNLVIDKFDQFLDIINQDISRKWLPSEYYHEVFGNIEDTYRLNWLMCKKTKKNKFPSSLSNLIPILEKSVQDKDLRSYDPKCNLAYAINVGYFEEFNFNNIRSNKLHLVGDFKQWKDYYYFYRITGENPKIGNWDISISNTDDSTTLMICVKCQNKKYELFISPKGILCIGDEKYSEIGDFNKDLIYYRDIAIQSEFQKSDFKGMYKMVLKTIQEIIISKPN